MKQVGCSGQVVMRSVGPAVPMSRAFCRPPPSPACSEKPPAAAPSRGPSQWLCLSWGGGWTAGSDQQGEAARCPPAHSLTRPLNACWGSVPARHRNPKLTQNDCVHLVLRLALRPQTLRGNGEGWLHPLPPSKVRDPRTPGRAAQSPGGLGGRGEQGAGWGSTGRFLPWECHGQRSLVGYSRWGCKELDMTEQLTLSLFKKAWEGLPLVAQWMRICLPMQGTTVQSLTWDDSTCQGATRLVPHSSWACSRARKLQLLSLCAAATETRARACAWREATSMKSPHRTTKIQYNQK